MELWPNLTRKLCSHLWFFGHRLDGNMQGGRERSIRLHACACVGKAVPQTITEGVTVLVLLATNVGVPIYMIGAVFGPIDPPQNAGRK